MKSPFKNPFSLCLVLCGLLGGAVPGYSDVTVKVDSTQAWLGYMNLWETNGTTYVQGFAFGTGELRAAFIPTNSPSGWPLNTHLVLKPNTNTYNPADPYWNYANGNPNKIVEANFYRDVGTNFGGQTVTFEGTLLSNSIPAITGGDPTTGWEVLAVVKDFTTYSQAPQVASTSLTAPGPFTVSLLIPAGHICQWGFIVKGPNTAPGSANSLTGAGISVEDSDPAITSQPASMTIPAGITTNLSVAAVGSAALTYQWKTNGVSLVNGGKYSGVNSNVLTIVNAGPTNSGSYVVTVSNTVTQTTLDSAAALLTVLDIVVTTNPVSQRVRDQLIFTDLFLEVGHQRCNQSPQ
jgi:hypothetical protein